MRDIRRRTRGEDCFPAGISALMPVAERLRHIAGTKWGTRQYLKMDRIKEAGELTAAYGKDQIAIARTNVQKIFDTINRRPTVNTNAGPRNSMLHILLLLRARNVGKNGQDAVFLSLSRTKHALYLLAWNR